MSQKQSFEVLLTCFNRKLKTLEALNNLFLAYNKISNLYFMQVYLTDDKSTDGTSMAVKANFPEVKIIKGSALYIGPEMRNSWNEAKKKNIPHIYYLMMIPS